jgi:hypothetical protein
MKTSPKANLRLETEEIEITPEMIEAGMNVVWKTDIMDPREPELRAMVRNIFTSMLSASRLRHS